MLDILPHIFVIAFFWFVIYWVMGGVFFGAIAIVRVIKLRRARFSCLFTLASALCAFGAAYTGTFYAHENIRACIKEANDVFGKLASVIACGILEQVSAGFIWFLILIGVGLLFFVLCRASNQSWMDSEDDGRDELDILEL